MKFGLMYEIQIPEPHYPGIEQERYNQFLAQAELADQVGFDYFWTVEHHFLKEFSHCSAPEVLRSNLPAHQTNPYRTRCSAVTQPVQPSGTDRRAVRGIGHSQQWSHGPWHRSLHNANRDGRF